MKNAISFIESLGFALSQDGENWIANRPLKEESIKELELSNNFYETSVYVKDGSVHLRGSLDDISLLASELIDVDTHDKRSIESLLVSSPYTLNEISDELFLSRDSALKELERLKKTGIVYKIDDFFFHQKFCHKDTAKHVPLVLIEKYRAAHNAAKDLNGTIFEEKFLERAFFYKGIFLRFVFNGGSKYDVHN